MLHKPELTLALKPTIASERITVDLAYHLCFISSFSPQFGSSCLINIRFGENDTNDVVYTKAARDLLPLALGGGVGTLFAYGQVCNYY